MGDQFYRGTEARLYAARARFVAAAEAELTAQEVTAAELLAILAHTVGACIALQNNPEMTPQIAFDLVLNNIHAGNREAVVNLLRPRGRMN